MERYDIEAKHPDDFVLESIDITPAAIIRSVTEQLAAYRNPVMTMQELLERFREIGLIRAAAKRREMWETQVETDFR